MQFFIKKWSLIYIAIFSCANCHANNSEKTQTLLLNVVLQNTHGYFVLSDGSCWKAIGFSPRWRSLSEWWQNVQLVPETYKCLPADWYTGAEIEILPKQGNIEINECNASNQEILEQCTHLLINSHTAQVLFAITLTLAECILQISNASREEGYAKGFANGLAEGRQAGYNLGYLNGQNEAPKKTR